MDINDILQRVQSGELSIDEAAGKIKYLPFEDIKYAMVDYHRELRVGSPEVIYCEGKSLEHLRGIAESMKKNGAKNILATRADKDMFKVFAQVCENAVYHEDARLITVQNEPPVKKKGIVLVVSGGTSDIPVCEEAAVTLEFLGNTVERLYDVGVAGLHRLLSRLEIIQRANVIIVVAGMEGALASVVGGLTDKPVVAVPTSIGYGANLGGMAALLSMLNSCASGVGVVNIDNGFGAAYLANNINKIGGY